MRCYLACLTASSSADHWVILFKESLKYVYLAHYLKLKVDVWTVLDITGTMQCSNVSIVIPARSTVIIVLVNFGIINQPFVHFAQLIIVVTVNKMYVLNASQLTNFVLINLNVLKYVWLKTVKNVHSIVLNFASSVCQTIPIYQLMLFVWLNVK